MQNMTEHTLLFIQGIGCMVLMLLFGQGDYISLAYIFATIGMVLYLLAVRSQDKYEKRKNKKNS